MIVHGRFDNRFPHRPIVSCSLMHPAIKPKISWDFVIDTGADKTFIVPDYQNLLSIPKKYLQFETRPVQTLGGPFKFKFMTHCTLVFNDAKNQPHEIKDLTVYFAAQKGFGNQGSVEGAQPEKTLVGEGKFPNVLGRDVLSQVSLGFCKTNNVLFVTKHYSNYLKALNVKFARPKKELKYLDEECEIVVDTD